MLYALSALASPPRLHPTAVAAVDMSGLERDREMRRWKVERASARGYREHHRRDKTGLAESSSGAENNEKMQHAQMHRDTNI